MEKVRADDISILKSIWKKNEDGVFGVHGLKSLRLKPRAGFQKNYFKIHDEIELMTQTPRAIKNFFTSFGTTEFLLRQSIVPVVAWNDGDDEIKCIGTGFFISASGLLMTAAHVIRDPIDEKYASVTAIGEHVYQLGESLHFGVLIPANPAMRNAGFLICPFEWVRHWGKEVKGPFLHKKPEFKLDLDVAICKVQESPSIGPYQPLNIGQHSLKVGDRAVAIGYAEMRNIRFNGDRYEPELLVSVGSVISLHSNNMTERQNPTPGPNFRFDAKIPGKMSGAPILVGGGILTKGIVSRSWTGVNDASGCLIGPLMSLPVTDGKSLLDMMKGGGEGIPQINGVGL